MRWIVAAALFGAVAYLKRAGSVAIPWSTVLALTLVVVALNLAYWSILRRSAPRWLKYVTTATDLGLISLLVLFTGGGGSVFYVAYFIVLVSNSIRYGMGMALYVATVYNLTYVAVLSFVPPSGDLTTEAVKILAFWGVALYAGYLAMRFQRYARILESYEETIARLRSELSGPKPAK
ncbi:MAG: hypothetical protein ACRDFR_07015 [Candidatus Limnocylindria bacterium]